MLKFFVAIALAARSFAAGAQHILRGVVKSQSSGEPLSGATIQLMEIQRIAVTNELGEFVFDRIAEGTYSAQVRYLGYKTADVSWQVPVSNSIEVLLEEDVVMTDQVIVMATRVNEKTPTTFSTISRVALQKQNFGQDLPFILNWTPSLVTTSDAGAGVGYTGLRIRGSDATRINVTINGIPLNDSESQGVFWVNTPDLATSTQSIQVQRGVGTSTNGAGAFGASVNLQTNTRNDDAYADVINSVGSFNTRDNTLTLLGVGNVEGRILRADANHPSEYVLLRSGLVGFHLPELHASVTPVTPGDWLILATDGVRSDFADDASLNAAPADLAARILDRYFKGTDDGLVLAARYLGGQHE